MKIFKKLFGNRAAKKGVVGISFLPEGFAIAVANYTQNNKPHLIYCEFLRLFDADSIASSLERLSTQFKLSDYECHLILIASDYRRINIETPVVAEDELNDAIRWKIADLIDYPISNALMDFYPAPPPIRSSDRKFCDVIVSPKLAIEQQTMLCTGADLNMKVIDIQETCLRNLAALLPENKRGVAILHLQETVGTILIQRDATIYLSRTLDIGYSKLSLQDNYDSFSEHIHEHNNLTLEIQRSLDYVENYYGLPPISSLAVIPIALNTQALLNILNSTPGITARIMDISTIVDCDVILDDATQCNCAPVIGTTLRYALKLE